MQAAVYEVFPLRDIPIQMEDELLHSDERPFCPDGTCPCHEDSELITPVAQAVQYGELTSEEATRYVLGRNI